MSIKKGHWLLIALLFCLFYLANSLIKQSYSTGLQDGYAIGFDQGYNTGVSDATTPGSQVIRVQRQ